MKSSSSLYHVVMNEVTRSGVSACLNSFTVKSRRMLSISSYEMVGEEEADDDDEDEHWWWKVVDEGVTKEERKETWFVRNASTVRITTSWIKVTNCIVFYFQSIKLLNNRNSIFMWKFLKQNLELSKAFKILMWKSLSTSC